MAPRDRRVTSIRSCLQAVVADYARPHAHHGRSDLAGREPLEELAVRPGRHRRRHPRGRRGHAQRVRRARWRRPFDELREPYIGHDPRRIELLLQRMIRDVYTEGGQLHMTAVAAIEVACWDIIGKAVGRPVYDAPGRPDARPRARLRQRLVSGERTPEAFAQAARDVVARGYTALKFDPFGAAWRIQDAARGGPLHRHRRGRARRGRAPRGPHDRGPQPLQRVDAPCASPTAWRPSGRPGSRSPYRTSTSGRWSRWRAARRCRSRPASRSGPLQQFAELLAHDAVHILQPEPLYLGGLWRTRQVAGMVDAHYGVVAPHNAQGPVCGAVSCSWAPASPTS